MDASRGPHGMPGLPGTLRPGMPGMPWMPGCPVHRDFQLPPADVSHVRRKWLDVTYAPTSAAQRLDIYLPDEGDGPFPVIFYTHGGAFAIGDKRDLHLLPYLRGLERGYAVVSVNYRLSGEAIFPAGLQDAKAAIRWLRAHGGEYGLDASRIAACGGSSGANYRRDDLRDIQRRACSTTRRWATRSTRATCWRESTGSGRPTSSRWTSISLQAVWGRATTVRRIRPSRGTWARPSPRFRTRSGSPTP